jgi:hypothetical protein
MQIIDRVKLDPDSKRFKIWMEQNYSFFEQIRAIQSNNLDADVLIEFIEVEPNGLRYIAVSVTGTNNKLIQDVLDLAKADYYQV